ncbi:MAG TPA: hypothetical protein VGH65_06260 [Verrucomicrobiaceae bacterium]
MTLCLLTTLRRAAMAGALALALAACSATNPPGPGGQITKVKYYHLESQMRPIPGVDPPITFERDYYLYGAVSNKDRLLRDGHYYVVMWKVTDPSQPVKVRLEYRQQKTGTTLKTIEKEVSKIDKRNLTRFEVNGQSYVDSGPVTSWRASVVRGKQVLAEAKSYLWE